MENTPLGAGMGTSGLVGQIGTINAMGIESLPTIILIQILLPALLSFLIYVILKKKGLIKDGDLKIDF